MRGCSSWVLNAPDWTIFLELILSRWLVCLQSFSSPPAGSEVLKLKVAIGYNGNGRGNMVWNPDTGTLGGLWRDRAWSTCWGGIFALTQGFFALVKCSAAAPLLWANVS